jgi:hypothetical protein
VAAVDTVAAVDAVAATMKSTCCKHMFQVFQIFQRYVVIVLYERCKSRSEDVAHVSYIVSVLEACCKCFKGTFKCFI